MLLSLQTLNFDKSCVKRCFKSTCMHVSVYEIICDVNYQIWFLNTDILDSTFPFRIHTFKYCRKSCFKSTFMHEVYIKSAMEIIGQNVAIFADIKNWKSCVKRRFKSTCMHVSVYKIICDVNYRIWILNTDILDTTFTFCRHNFKYCWKSCFKSTCMHSVFIKSSMEIIGQNVTIFTDIKFWQILCETLL